MSAVKMTAVVMPSTGAGLRRFATDRPVMAEAIAVCMLCVFVLFIPVMLIELAWDRVRGAKS